MGDDDRALVKPDEVLSVIKEIHGPSCKLLDYEVEKATTSVQGFLSNILRVAAKVEKITGEKVKSKFIIKRLPKLKNQLELAHETGIFRHEIGFFEQCAPILWKQCPDPPVVKCFGTNLEKSIIYMEDLKELGYIALIRSIPDLKDQILTIDHVKLVIETLANFHSTSAGVDWLAKCPHMFQKDIMYEETTVFKKMFQQSIKSNILSIVELHFADNESFVRTAKWLASDDCFQKLASLSKADPKEVNVLCHGDSWANNMMFKIDQDTGKPLDIKLIDFQICRYAPCSRDLLYFLYICTQSEFRNKYEKEILELYVKTFNENSSKLGKDVRLEWETFYEEFDKSRLVGLIMTALVRPMIYIKGVVPVGNEDLTEDHVDKIFDGGAGASAAIQEFATNEDFRREFENIVREAVDICDKNKLSCKI